MIISCSACSGTGLLAGQSCYVCGGDGEINITDKIFDQVSPGVFYGVAGVVWNVILTKIAAQDVEISDLKDKVNDIMDKCNDIFEKVNE